MPAKFQPATFTFTTPSPNYLPYQFSSIAVIEDSPADTETAGNTPSPLSEDRLLWMSRCSTAYDHHSDITTTEPCREHLKGQVTFLRPFCFLSSSFQSLTAVPNYHTLRNNSSNTTLQCPPPKANTKSVRPPRIPIESLPISPSPTILNNPRPPALCPTPNRPRLPSRHDPLPPRRTHPSTRRQLETLPSSQQTSKPQSPDHRRGLWYRPRHSRFVRHGGR